LRHRKDFDNVFAEGRAWSDPLLVMRALPNGLGLNRYGFITSKRLGGAVVRNRVRRRLREIVRALDVEQGYDVVLSAKTTAPAAAFDDLRLAVQRLVARAGMAPGAKAAQ
jgi:ribonuclease P protein component